MSHLTQFLKDGFNAALVKSFHIYLPLAALVVYGALTLGLYWDEDPSAVQIAKKNFPGYK